MQSMINLFSKGYQALAGVLPSLSFLAPIAYSLLGVALLGGILELFGVHLGDAWKQLLIMAAIVGVVMSVGQWVGAPSANDPQGTTGDLAPNALTTAVTVSPGNVFVPSSELNIRAAPGILVNCETDPFCENPVEIRLSNTLNGLPVDGSIPAIGQNGAYSYWLTPHTPDNLQRPPIVVTSPEPPSSYSAQQLSLKKAVDQADVNMFNFIRTPGK
jgi:hypothetical protein